jgi:hypothetical protein
MKTLLLAARAVVQEMGGVKAVAQALGCNATTLAHELDPNYEGAKLGVDRALQIDQLHGEGRIATAFASASGGVFMPLPKAAGGAGDDTLQHVSRLVSEFGDVLREVSSSTADGRITDNELQQFLAEALQVQGALNALIAHLSRLNQAAKPQHLQRVA